MTFFGTTIQLDWYNEGLILCYIQYWDSDENRNLCCIALPVLHTLFLCLPSDTRLGRLSHPCLCPEIYDHAPRGANRSIRALGFPLCPFSCSYVNTSNEDPTVCKFSLKTDLES